MSANPAEFTPRTSYGTPADAVASTLDGGLSSGVTIPARPMARKFVPAPVVTAAPHGQPAAAATALTRDEPESGLADAVLQLLRLVNRQGVRL